MVLLKEDGSLDIERINKLPIEEYMSELGKLSQKQRDEYWSKQPINESKDCPRAIYVDYPMEQDGVDAQEFINIMRNKYVRKC